MNAHTMTLRLSRAVLDHLDGTSLFQQPDRLDLHGYGSAGHNLVTLVRRATRRSDGSVRVTLFDAEVDVLVDYVETWHATASSVIADETSALGEVNAARALLRHVEAARSAR